MEERDVRLAEKRTVHGGGGSVVGGGEESRGGWSSRDYSSFAKDLQAAIDESSTVFHVFCSDPVSLNLAVFELWVKGFREEQVVYYRRGLLGDELDISEKQLLLLLFQDAIDQYRLLQMLEEYLVQPSLLERQRIVQMSPEIQHYMITKYHEFDDELVRELLGRKLTTKARKDLDEVAESTGILLPSCRRQFDNIKRIFNAMDERNFEGNITNSIVEQYHIPWDLAERFTCILFLLYNKFHIQSGRKKTGFIKLVDLEYCAALMLLYWVTETSSDGVSLRFSGMRYFGQERRLNASLITSLSNPSSTASQQQQQPEDLRALEGLDDSRRSLRQQASIKSMTKQDDSDEVQRQQPQQQNLDEDADLAADGDDSVEDEIGEQDMIESNESLEKDKVSPLKELSSHASSAQSATMPLPRIRAVSVSRSNTLSQSAKPGNTSMEISPTLIWKWRLIKNHIFVTRNVLDGIVKDVMTAFSGACHSVASQSTLKKLKTRYKTWAKSLLTIAAGLAQAKELRDFFEDVIALLCEPLHFQVGLSSEALELLLQETHHVFSNVPFIASAEHCTEWETFMVVMSPLIRRMYRVIISA